MGTEGLTAYPVHCTIQGLERQAVLLSHFPGLDRELQRGLRPASVAFMGLEVWPRKSSRLRKRTETPGEDQRESQLWAQQVGQTWSSSLSSTVPCQAAFSR